MSTLERDIGWRPGAFYIVWVLVAVVGVAATSLGGHWPWLQVLPAQWVLPVQGWLTDLSEGVTTVLKPVARVVASVLDYPMSWVATVLTESHWIGVYGAIVALGAWIKGWRMALYAAAALGFVVASGYWSESMNTLSLIVVSVPLALALGLMIGIAAYRLAHFRPAVEAMLDFMQTVPTFAYLIPLLVLFGFGPVVGLIASAVYAAPPMARNTLLGLQLVHPEIKEAAVMSGANVFQRLILVELPAATSQIMVGVNQAIMACLSMVIIAAVIGGFNDIGWEVLLTMRKAQFGESLLAGSVIVVFAMLMDRMSAALTTDNTLGQKPAQHLAMVIAGCALVCVFLISNNTGDSTHFPWLRDMAAQLSTGLDSFVVDYGAALQGFKNTILFYVMLPLKIGLDDAVLDFTWGFIWSDTLNTAYILIGAALAIVLFVLCRPALAIGVVFLGYVILVGVTQVPWPLMITIAAGIGWLAGGLRTSLFAAAAFLMILFAGLWDKAMLSLYLCATATLVCAVAGISLGILAATSDNAWRVLRPICDTLQTIPLFVFLIPVLMLFQIGEFSAFLAIVAYAIVPSIRYTRHGIVDTPSTLVEAAVANGCTAAQKLFYVRLPYAIPSILLGLNQTILYGFAMLVIAALIGTTDLGQSIYVALGRADMGLGLSAGIAMALLAMVADRIVQGFAAAHKRAMGVT